MDGPASEWPPIPGDGLERLAFWRERRAAEANERERRMVAEALFRQDLG